MNPLKIAFVGTSCVGKTTLIEHYRKKFHKSKKVVFVEEAARIFFQNNPKITKRFEINVQTQIQAMTLQNEQKAHAARAEIILCDRSVIDVAAYALAFGDKTGAELLFNKVRPWLKTYHKLLLLNPLDVPYTSDDVRLEDESTRQKIHKAFLELFGKKKIQYKLLRGKIDERIKIVDKLLQLEKLEFF